MLGTEKLKDIGDWLLSDRGDLRPGWAASKGVSRLEEEY